MFRKVLKVAAITAAAGACLASFHARAAETAAAPPPAVQALTTVSETERRALVEAVARQLAEEFAQACPVAAPADEAAYASCRKALYGSEVLRGQLDPIVLWGRQRDTRTSLKDSSLTQFATDVLTGLYLPLFMFDGQYRVEPAPREGLYVIRLHTGFRNRLAPGLFPYPFWHDDEKWTMYQDAREVMLFWNPVKGKITTGQYTVHSPLPSLASGGRLAAPKPFDGHWMWTDASGRAQPKVTLFDGLYRADNPYLQRLDGAYQQLALRLREGQCDHCHVPNNPDHMKRLVLMQTPAHAAGEIDRMLKAVREDRMPRDDAGIEQPLDAPTKQALLRDGEAFAQLVHAAQAWETLAAAQGRAQARRSDAVTAAGTSGTAAVR